MSQPVTFIPTEDFFSEAFGSQYCKDMTYTIRPDNERLLRYATEWAKEGKVIIKEPNQPQPGTQPATLGGNGEVR